MTKATKIKICRDFLKHMDIYEIIAKKKSEDWTRDDIENALRWGLKHPEELRKGKP